MEKKPSYEEWKELILGFPKGLICGSLLFKTHICTMFFKNENIELAGFTDDNTSYGDANLEKVILTFNNSLNTLFE